MSSDHSASLSPGHADSKKKTAAFSLTVAALGVVFGDIGTSPLYAMRECFSPLHGIARSEDNILGIVSLLVWTLTLVVCVKYLGFVVRADNKGEGGILSLISLVSRSLRKNTPRKLAFVAFIGVLGASLLYSDGIITPSITVLSAVEGLELMTPGIQPYVVPIALALLVTLFLFQSRGTHKVGGLFGPLIAIWFVTIGVLGLVSIANCPRILLALNPVFAIKFFVNNGVQSFVVLGSVFLAMTGAEVLYADLGHFGKKPIRRAWYFLVFPGLILNYAGQGAFILGNGGAVDNYLFFHLAPEWFRYPLTLIATVASIIASQAVISGAFSLARQSVQLGFLPRMQIRHTSMETIGQVYVPFINWALMVGTIGLVIGFQESSRIGAAYGIAVSADMLITTFLLSFVANRLWKLKWIAILPIFLLFLMIDGFFFSANSGKIVSGGWIVVAFSVVLVTVMKTWIDGRTQLRKDMESSIMPVDLFESSIAVAPPQRVKGTAVFLAGNPKGIPIALLHNLKHNRILHEQTIILSVQTSDQPMVAHEQRFVVHPYNSGIWHMIIYFGFSEIPDLPKAMEALEVPGLAMVPAQTTWFLGRESLVVSKHRRKMAHWRKRVFWFLSHNAQDATNFFRLPPNRVVEIGAQIEI